jgi:hypothetical protein
LRINAIKCLKCGDVIYSRSRHDFHWCSCESCAIDGGFDYMKITGNREDWESVQIDVFENKTDNEVKKILFDDWNKGKNKYGVLKNSNE